MRHEFLEVFDGMEVSFNNGAKWKDAIGAGEFQTLVCISDTPATISFIILSLVKQNTACIESI